MRHNLLYFWRLMLRRDFRQVLYYHRAQRSLYGWPYLWGVRNLQTNGEARYRETMRRYATEEDLRYAASIKGGRSAIDQSPEAAEARLQAWGMGGTNGKPMAPLR